jgi:hypothetical protein
VTEEKELEPLRLVEDEATGATFLLYSTDKGVKAELRFEDEQPWFTQAQLAEIFGVSVPTANEHIARFRADGELDEATIRKFRMVRNEGGRRVEREIEHYGLDVAFYVGYRVNSGQGILFRRWATQILTQYAVKGFVIDTKRLKDPDSFDRIRELRDIIAEIRASDVNMYGELRRICTFAQDYDAKSKAWRDFYARIRAKLYWAVTSQTPSMIMADRADADAPHMGLQSWAGDEICQKDAASPKSYLAEAEFRELNRVTIILLDVFDDQADRGKLTTMKVAEELFDRQLRLLERPVLKHGGSVSTEQAETHAKAEYKKFDAKRKADRLGIEAQAYLELKAQGKTLSKARTPRKKNSAS